MLSSVRNVVVLGGVSLTGAIDTWKLQKRSENVPMGGRSSYANDSNVSGSNATGRTFVNTNVASRIRQNGYVKGVTFYVVSVGAATWKFKLMRPNGADYDVVAETPFITPAGTGERTIEFATPLGPAIPGDTLAVHLVGSGTAIAVTTQTNGTLFRTGDVGPTFTASGATNLNFELYLQPLCTPPFLIGTGDSIMEGHNSASPWHSHYHTGPSGNLAASPLNQMTALVPTLETQNFGQGSQTWAGTATKAAAIALQKPKAVIVQCGVNDVSGARTWNDVKTDMDTFKAGLPVGTVLFINEILPWTAGNDTQAGTIRTFNANYAAWCVDNGAVLVRCHDQMGQTRVSTGQLDDLLTAYNYDNVHQTVPAGVDALASLMVAALKSRNW